jgi:hypothetical protein
MTVNHFKPQIWSKLLLAALQKALVYGGPGVVNRDYEGSISEAGDTVHISSIGDPTVSDYTGSVSWEDLQDAGQSLVIDQAKYFAFKVKDLDKRQAAGDLQAFVEKRANYKLADQADQFVANLYTGVASANALGTIPVTTSTPTDAYDKILVPLKVTLDNANVPTPGRYVVVPPWLHGRLLLDSRFIKVNESGTSEGLRNGHVGTAAGFDILMSNNAPLVTGDDYAVMAGTPDAISFVDQIVEMEAMRLEGDFADGVRGLHVYGGKLIRPDGIATAVASQT